MVEHATAREQPYVRHTKSRAMYLLVSAAMGAVAYLLLSLSPPANQVIDDSWHPLKVAPLVGGAVVSAWLLRRLVARSGIGSLFAVGVLHAFSSAVLFAVTCVVLGRIFVDQQPLAVAASEGLLAVPYGVLYCAAAGYVTVPLGVMTVWLLRRVTAQSRTATANG